MNVKWLTVTLSLLCHCFVTGLCKEYGVELEILSLTAPAGTRPNSLQYDFSIEYKRSADTSSVPVDSYELGAFDAQVPGSVLFPEVEGRNPIRVQVEEGDEICFRLDQNLKTIVGDCSHIGAQSQYYSTHYLNRWTSDGANVSYKLVQYRLANQQPEKLDISQDTSTCQSCTVPIVFACIEGGILFALMLSAAFFAYKFYYHESGNPIKNSSTTAPTTRRPVITVVRENPVDNVATIRIESDDSGTSTLGTSSHRSATQQNVHSIQIRDQEAADSVITQPSKYTDSVIVQPSKYTQATTKLKDTFTAASRKIKNTVNTKVLVPKPETAPPEPPPKDYQQEQQGEDYADEFDDEDEFYDDVDLQNEDSQRVPSTGPQIIPHIGYLQSGVNTPSN